MKIRLCYIFIVLVILVPLTAYVDTIRLGIYPFQQYLAIGLWEAGLVLFGVALGMIINLNTQKEQTKDGSGDK